MRNFEKRHPIIFFGTMALLFSLAFLPLHGLFREAGTYAVSFTQLGPLTAVLLLSFLHPEQRILTRIRKACSLRKISLKWAVITMVLPGLLVLTSGIILSGMGFGMASWSGSLLFYVLNLFGIIAGAVAEEAGWRGYLLPEFLKVHTPLRSAVYTGIIWGIWHLNFTGGLPGFLFYTVTIIEASILMTWIYHRTGGCLSLMVLFHVFFNLSSRMFLWERFRLELFIVESIVFGLACLYFYHADRKILVQKRAVVG